MQIQYFSTPTQKYELLHLFLSIVPGCWSSWSSWSSCIITGQCKNLNGTRSRSRSCTTGFGTYRSDCDGHDAESGDCRVEKTCKLSSPLSYM